jgi:uncharacterized membrane protein
LVEFTGGLPGDWTSVNNAPGNPIFWTNLAGCGEGGNWATGNGDAACASSNLQGGVGLYDTELRTPPIDLTTSLTATINYWVNYQNWAFGDFLELDISADGGNNWSNLLSWNEDHPPDPVGFRIAPGEFVALNLDSFVGQTVMLRWHYFDPVGPFQNFDWYAQVDEVQLLCSSIPTIGVNPDSLESFQATDSQVTRTLSIENLGGGILDWMIDEAVAITLPDINQAAGSSWTPPPGFDMSIFQQSAPDDYVKPDAPAVAPGNTVLFDQPDDPGNSTGAVSNYSTGNMLGIFSADDFLLTHTAKINLIFADGYDDSNELPIATAIDWYIYPDSGSGTPAGYPGDSSGIEVWHYTSAPGNAGVDITNDMITLDLTAAGEMLELPPGLYWLVIYPTFSASDIFFDHWLWFDAIPAATSTADAMIIDPDNYLGIGLTMWTPIPSPGVDSLAFRIEGDYVNLNCPPLSDLPWLSVTPTSGATGGGSSTAVDVIFDSTGLSTGVYTGTLCVDSNDVISPKIQVPITLNVVIPSYSLVVGADSNLTGDPGTTVAHTIVVTNTGNVPDIIEISMSGASWATTPSVTAVQVLQGASIDVLVDVDIPPGTLAGEMDTAVFTAISQGSGNTLTDTATITTTVDAVYGVLIEPDYAATAQPGSTITYTLIVTNTANTTDTINLAVSGAVWTTNLATSSVMLATGESVLVDVTVDVPVDAAGNQVDTAVVTATSANDGTASDTATLATTAAVVASVTVSPDEAMAGLPGDAIAYTVVITNEGNFVDTFDLAVLDNSWATAVVPTAVTLNAGQAQSVAVTVNIPTSAFGGEMDAALVTATSQSDSDVNDEATLTTTVLTVYAVAAGQDESAKALPGTTITYSVAITNLGTVTDTFALTAVGVWTTNVEPTSVMLLPQETAVVLVSTDVPAEAVFGEIDTAVFTITSTTDTSANDSVSLTTIVGANYYVELTAPESALSGLPATTVTYTVWVTNTGNLPDTFDLTASGVWTTTTSVPTATLASGEGIQLWVTVQIPADAADSDSDVTLVTAVSNNSTAAVTLTTTALADGYFIYLPFVARNE